MNIAIVTAVGVYLMIGIFVEFLMFHLCDDPMDATFIVLAWPVAVILLVLIKPLHWLIRKFKQ